MADSTTYDESLCWGPCDPDCELGEVHCSNDHLPRHKWAEHSDECIAAHDGERCPIHDFPSRALRAPGDSKRIAYHCDALGWCVHRWHPMIPEDFVDHHLLGDDDGLPEVH